MKRTLWLLIALLCLAVLEAATSTKPLIKIGMIGPISGNSSDIGQNMRDGILLRLSQVPDSSAFSYTLVAEDDGFESARTNLAVSKLRNLDKVDAIISSWGQATSVIVPRLQGSQILNLSADRWGGPATPYAYDFAIGPNVDRYTTAMINALKGLQVKRVALFSSAVQGEVAYDKMFKAKLKAAGIELVYYSMLPDDIRDFRTAILKAREQNPDVVLNDLLAPQMEILIKQRREINYRPLLASPSTMFIYVNEKELVEGAFYTLNQPSDTGFLERFKKHFGHDASYPAMYTYDTASLFINACEQLPSNTKPTGEAIAAKLRGTQGFPGALGPISYEAPSSLSAPIAYYVIEHGQSKAVTLEELIKFYKK